MRWYLLIWQDRAISRKHDDKRDMGPSEAPVQSWNQEGENIANGPQLDYAALFRVLLHDLHPSLVLPSLGVDPITS
jgi:hypothetical protein